MTNAESPHSPTVRDRAWLLEAMIVPATTGFVTGMFVGASRDPAVGAFLPGFLAIGSALIVGIAERQSKRREWLVKLLSNPELDDVSADAKAKLERVIAHEPQHGTRYALIIATLVFCAALVAGSEYGISRRVIPYPSVREMFRESKDVDPVTRAQLAHLRWALQSQNIPYSDAKRACEDVIVPLLQSETVERGDAFLATLKSKITRLSSTITVIARFMSDWQDVGGLKVPPADYDSARFRKALTGQPIAMLLSISEDNEDSLVSSGPAVCISILERALEETRRNFDQELRAKIQAAASILLTGTHAATDVSAEGKTVIYRESIRTLGAD